MKKLLIFSMLLMIITGCNTPSFEFDSIQIIMGSEYQASTNTNCVAGYSYGDKATPKILNENSYYYSRDDVALYLDTFNKLPPNYYTKDEVGNSTAGSSTRIGGDYFSNGSDQSPTGLCLPPYSSLTECDVDASGSSGSKRGAKRLVFTLTYKIFYTYDHYEHWQEYLGYKNWGPVFASGYYKEICK